MSVFTNVTLPELNQWLEHYSIGEASHLQGIAAGIENTNYFITTAQGAYVLTLFEKLTLQQLPFYLNLMAHLSAQGVDCPAPLANRQGQYLGILNGKPASLVSRLKGTDLTQPSIEHCAQVGQTLARIHLAGQSYRGHMSNPRGPSWWRAVAPTLQSFLSAPEQHLLDNETRFQAASDFSPLPQGAIHADLFRDNVLFFEGKVTGVIDFYFACTSTLLYDVAITVNDWCLSESANTPSPPRLDPDRLNALLHAYAQLRPFTAEEHKAWPTFLRAGALRFWVSRLYDLHLPRTGTMTHTKDPRHFQKLLMEHQTHTPPLPCL